MILLFVLMIVAMYFLLIRPQQKRKREQQKMQSNAGVGAEVMTVGGLYGTIVDTDDESVTIEVSPGVTNRYAKGAIGRVITPADQVADDSGDDDDTDTSAENIDDVEAAADEVDDEPAKGKKAKQQVGASKPALPRDPTAN